MKKVIQVKLVPDTAQSLALERTSQVFLEVCNWLSEKAFEAKTFNHFMLHKLCYKEARDRFQGFSSQLIVRAIGVVCDAYRLDRRSQRVFKRKSVVYDQRILSWKGDKASIWTVNGRIEVPIRAWNAELFGRSKGQADLVHKHGKWFLMASVDVPEGTAYEPSGWLGVDLGIVNLVVASDGSTFSGEKVETTRQRYFRHRQRLQKRDTKSAKRRIKLIGNREAKFRRDVNHVISKGLVRKAKGTSMGIALEDLKGIRRRTTVRKCQRAKHAGWAFAQLRSFVEYKAKESGVPFRLVSARGTSRTCSVCRHEDKRNRKSQSEFLCLACGYSAHADLNASKNISRRAAINQPIVAQ